MVFRTAGALGMLLLGLVGPCGEASAQYYPPAQVYPPPQAYPPPVYSPQQVSPSYRPLPPLIDDDDFLYDPPVVQSRPLPPPPIAGPQPPEAVPAPGIRAGRAAPVYPEEAELTPLPPGYIYRDAQGNYRDAQGNYRDVQQGSEPPLDPNTRIARPAYGPPPALPPMGSVQPGQPSPPQQQDGVRPPMPIGPGQVDQGPGSGPTGALRGDPRVAALPPEVRPETGPAKELPVQFRRTLVDYRTKEPAGTIVIDTPNTYLYFVLGNGKAMRYGIGVGRDGFTWSGVEKVSKVAEWPDWHPPTEMIERQPYLPRFMAGGETNPLGARALYLGKTIYRIHGTNQPSTIGSFVSSGCIRLTNADVLDLYTRVKVGTRVVVLPGKPPATTTATPIAPPTALVPGAPPVSMAPIAPPPSAMAR